MHVAPYLFFNGRCEEALEFYASALGAKVETIMRFSEAPPSDEMKLPPGSETKIMHAAFKLGDATLMASDGMCSGDKPTFKGCALSLDAPDIATAEKLFDALAAEGKVQQPLIETFFAPRFGMVADKFGVDWMVLSSPQA